MTTILDTDQPVQCGSCKTFIWPSESKAVIGYGSLLIVMHANCWEVEEILRNDQTNREYAGLRKLCARAAEALSHYALLNQGEKELIAELRKANS